MMMHAHMQACGACNGGEGMAPSSFPRGERGVIDVFRFGGRQMNVARAQPFHLIGLLREVHIVGKIMKKVGSANHIAHQKSGQYTYIGICSNVYQNMHQLEEFKRKAW